MKNAKRGYVLVQLLGMIFLTLMFSAVAVDMTFYWAAQTNLQSAADAGSLAGMQELFTSSDPSPTNRQAQARIEAANLVSTYSTEMNTVSILPDRDVEFGFIDPTIRKYDAASFLTPSTDTKYAATGGYNAVRVIVRKDGNSPGGTLPTIMANMFGVSEMDTLASAVAMMDDTLNQVTGVRPFYGCLEQYNLAMEDNDPTNNIVRVFGPHHTFDGDVVDVCPLPPSGNWGFADFRNDTANSPGINDITDWVLNGYTDSPVYTDTEYSVQTGDAISSSGVRNALQYLMDNQTVITVPLIDSNDGDSGSGSAAMVRDYAGFVITDFKWNGSPSTRYIEGYFTNNTCGTGCGTNGSNTGGGTVTLRLVN